MRVKKNYRSFHCRSRSHNVCKSTVETPEQGTALIIKPPERRHMCAYIC